MGQKRASSDGFNTPFADLKHALRPQTTPAAANNRNANAQSRRNQAACAPQGVASEAAPRHGGDAGAPAESRASGHSEQALFLQAMADVQPLVHDRCRIEPQKRRSTRSSNDDAQVLQHLHDLVNGEAEFRLSETGEFQYGLAPGVNYRVLHTLKEGGFAFRRHIDLHGHTREEAHAALSQFITEARRDGERCVLVITGRGKRSPGGISVLRETLGRWLSRSPLRGQVLAFCTARLVDGGPGAFYVLLRRLGVRPF